jgi:NAD-dependent deacetylase
MLRKLLNKLAPSGPSPADVDDALLRKARRLLAARSRIAVFSGAGISAESGIPTFRGEHGLWSEAPPEIFGTPWGIMGALQQDPGRLADMLGRILDVLLAAEPNPAHRAIADLDRRGILGGVITQNVDDLHERAGARRIVKLHGDLFRWRCIACGAQRTVERPELAAIRTTLGDAHFAEDLLSLIPICGCGHRMRPDIVLFGEALPSDALTDARRILGHADAVLVVGTSAVVEPAASLVRDVPAPGVPIIEINLEPSGVSDRAEVSLFAPAGIVLPALVAPFGRTD